MSDAAERAMVQQTMSEMLFHVETRLAREKDY